MTRWGAFLWTALAAAACSIVVTLKVSPLQTDMRAIDAEILRAIEAVAGLIFLLAVSWGAAGIVLLISQFKAQRATLMLVSVAVSIAVSTLAVILLP
jgi:hypothetical protein